MAEPKIDPFEEEIILNVKNFADVCIKNFHSLLALEGASGPGLFSRDGIKSKKNMFLSILFTGTVFGEFVLALDQEVAARALSKTLVGKTEDEAQEILQESLETFSELLNISVGESIAGLVKHYEKLTITTPKVHLGKVQYPAVKSAKSLVMTKAGEIECHLFVDRMKLDLTESYREALGSLESANKELLLALDKLREQQDHLVQSEKLAALGTMAAGVAHEINTPLATIVLVKGSLAEMIEDVTTTHGKEFIEGLDMIEKTIFRISKITNSLRDYAKSTAGNSFQSISVLSLVEESLIFCQNQIKDHGVQLILEKLPINLEVDCQIQQLSQVLFQLFANSVDAIEGLSDKWIKVEAAEVGEQIEIRITDSGKGIADLIQKSVFDPFFTTKDFGKGPGLGLSIARGIVENHKGRLVLNAKSLHTQFVLTLPRKQRMLKSA